ncbi:hypothetical protein Ancab_039157 [Ancistrocladus abbreviatus]
MLGGSGHSSSGLVAKVIWEHCCMGDKYSSLVKVGTEFIILDEFTGSTARLHPFFRSFQDENLRRLHFEKLYLEFLVVLNLLTSIFLYFAIRVRGFVNKYMMEALNLIHILIDVLNDKGDFVWVGSAMYGVIM